MNPLCLRTANLLRTRALSSTSKRFASTQSTISHATNPLHHNPPHYTPIQWVRKFVPIEAVPLIFLATSMSCYGLYHGYTRIVHVPGELRLLPKRFDDESLRGEEGKEPWEMERAKQGVW
ncbi:hypothetical protein JCM16303_002228 [Sporobolomyces ruberrimus]